jgi:hypothetical protein
MISESRQFKQLSLPHCSFEPRRSPVGRAVLCTPFFTIHASGAHRVTRPTKTDLLRYGLPFSRYSRVETSDAISRRSPQLRREIGIAASNQALS